MSAQSLDSGSAAVAAHLASALQDGRLVEWLQRFVSYPSEQTDLHERDPQVLGFIKECAGPLVREIGVSHRYDAMGNMIIEAGPESERSLLFVCYAMTHPAARMTDAFIPTVVQTPSGPAIRGRGVAEQKSALAALFGALQMAAHNNILRHRLAILLLTAGETGRHDAIKSALGELGYKPQAAVVCIGTNSRIAIGNKGRIDFDVIVQGKAAHSSAPWAGVNAITGAQMALQLLDQSKSGASKHPHFGAPTLTPTAIESAPRATHTVPHTTRITFDRRLLPGEDPVAVYESFKRAIVLPKPWNAECELGPIMYPNEISATDPLITRLKEAFTAATQAPAELFYCNFALDAGYLTQQGTPAVMLGPGDVDQFHSNEESVLVSELTMMSNVYYRMIELCLGPNA